MKQSILLLAFVLGTISTISAQSISTRFVKAPINSYVLDFAHTQKTWNNEKLKPGVYSYTIQTREKNEKKGKVNFHISVKQNNSYRLVVDEKVNSTGIKRGSFTVSRVAGSGSSAYGMVKVKVGRAGANTFANYSITITRTGDLPAPPAPSTPPCRSGQIGNKTGNVVGNTIGRYTSTKKVCKNSATVTVTKTGGKARTTILVYTSTTRNGSKSLVPGAKEFAKNAANGTQRIVVPNAKNKYIHVEIKNRSAVKSFAYRSTIAQ